MKHYLDTPICEAKWFHLIEPDAEYGNKYKVTLVLDPKSKEHQPFIERLTTLADELFEEEKAKITPKQQEKAQQPNILREDVDKETDEPTGLLLLTPRSGFKPEVVDSQGRPVNPVPKLGAGTKLRAKLTVEGFPFKAGTNYCGATVYLSSVQIIDAVIPSAFDPVEGGWVAPEVVEEVAPATNGRTLQEAVAATDDELPF